MLSNNPIHNHPQKSSTTVNQFSRSRIQDESTLHLPGLPTLDSTLHSDNRGPRNPVTKRMDVDGILGLKNDQTLDAPKHPGDQEQVQLSGSGSQVVQQSQDGICESSRDGLLQNRQQHSLCSFSSEEATRSVEPPKSSTFLRRIVVALTTVIILPLLHNSPLIGKAGHTLIGVEGGLIRERNVYKRAAIDGVMVRRDDSPTDVCTRWSHQSAIVNGTLYVYGGRASQDAGQNSSTWNNDFLTLDVTKTWQISSPTLNGLPQPSGPPPVANGYIWNSYDSLFLYGGEFSSAPATSPVAYALWEYDIASSSWSEHSNPQTSAGNNSDGGNQPVQQSAEGAGISVPELGRGWYFGGHLDGYTTVGWSQSVPRIYLKSLVEYTFPGYTNNGVQSLSGGNVSGSDGTWRNITQGGLQTSDGFPERADGVLVFVPGFGQEGIILGLAGGIGGNSNTFTQMNVIDIYDIATSMWYKQATSGTTPGIRVNPCAVAASAPDGSSTNVYMYGGQNLIPAGSQEQYSDMWILSIPSFSWIQVNTSNQSVPPARAGHTCNIWDGQVIVVGGYVGQNISCDSPGIYVFDASELKWQNQFTALSGGNTQNQQAAQALNSSKSSGESSGTSGSSGSAGNLGLSGSYGYQVPDAVQSIIGGNGNGGATITAPIASATEGPLATGKPITYTITASNGATVTETSAPSNPSSNPSSNQKGSGGPNIAAIVAGVVAGCFAILAGYLGFCAWVYRRQLKLYKNHVAMSQRAAAGGPNEKAGFLVPCASEGSSGQRGNVSTDRSSGPGGSGSATGTSGYSSIPPMPGVHPPVGGNSTANSSAEDLLSGQEPSFVGVLLNPRRSLRVINRD